MESKHLLIGLFIVAAILLLLWFVNSPKAITNNPVKGRIAKHCNEGGTYCEYPRMCKNGFCV